MADHSLEAIDARIGPFSTVRPDAIAWTAFSLLLVAAALYLPAAPFTVDELFYAQMAAAMAEEGRLAFTQMHLAGVDSVDFGVGQAVADGRIAPQYPAGYSLIAAPFYAAFGVNGLVALNALATLAAISLVYRIALRLAHEDQDAAQISAVLFAAGSMAVSYALAIWPHMLATAIILFALDQVLRSEGRAARPLIVAGLALGVACAVRVDAVLAVVAILVWLRAFIGGANRLASVCFVAALIPGLLLSAGANAAKFGVFHPFSYNAADGGASIAAYGPLAYLAPLGLAAIMAVDCRPLATRVFDRARRVGSRQWLIIGGAAFLLAMAMPPARELLRNYAILLIDLQLHPYQGGIDGVERDPSGVILFWGVYKKALVESMPFAVLALAGLPAFFTGEGRRGEGLLWLVIGAFVSFYALSRWHGGLSLNLRYFLPVAAPLSILAAFQLRALSAEGAPRKAVLYAAGVGILVFVLAFFESLAPGPARGVWEIYPALGVAGLLAAMLVWRGLRPSPENKRLAHLAAIVACVAGVMMNMGDLVRDRLIRGFIHADAVAFAEALPSDALVLSTDPVRFLAAMERGVSLVYPGLDDDAAVAAAVVKFHAAGRCVYADAGGAAAFNVEAPETGLISVGVVSPDCPPI